MGINKKLIILTGLISTLATIAFILYTSFNKLNDLDLSDPFEVDIDDE